MAFKQYDPIVVEGVVEYFGKNQFNKGKEPQFALKVITPDGEGLTYYCRMDLCSVYPRQGERVKFTVHGRIFTSLKAEYLHGEL